MRKTLSIIIALLAFPPLAPAADPRLEEAIAASRAQNLPEAHRLFAALLKESPKNTLYQFNFANILYLEKKYAEAAKLYAQVTRSPSKLAAPARLYLARCHLRLGQKRQATAILRELEAQNPSPAISKAAKEELAGLVPNAEAKSALEAYRAGKPAEAERLWKHELDSTPRADLYVAHALASLKAGKIRQAEASLLSALEKNPDPELAESARKLLAQIRDGEWDSERTLFPEARIALGYDSNFYNDSTSPADKAIFQSALQAQHTLQQKPNFQWLNRYALGMEGPFSPGSDRTFAYGLSTELVFSNDQLLFSPGLRFDHLFLGGDTYYVQPELFLKGRRYWRDWEFGADYSLARTSAAAAYSFLSGTLQEISASAYRNLGRVNYGLGLYYNIAATGDAVLEGEVLPMRYRSFGPTAFLLFTPKPRWEIDGRLSYRHRSYPTLAQPGTIERSDGWTNLFVQAAYSWASGLRATLSVNAVINSSTLGPATSFDRNYRQTVLLTGLDWSIE